MMPGRVYVPATQRNSALPTPVDDVLRRGLARDPDERYRSVDEFRKELAAALNLPDSAADRAAFPRGADS
jgi:hypothetical protein